MRVGPERTRALRGPTVNAGDTGPARPTGSTLAQRGLPACLASMSACTAQEILDVQCDHRRIAQSDSDGRSPRCRSRPRELTRTPTGGGKMLPAHCRRLRRPPRKQA